MRSFLFEEGGALVDGSKRVEVSPECTALVDDILRLGEACTASHWGTFQARFAALPHEQRALCWCRCSMPGAGSLELVKRMHSFVCSLVLECFDTSTMKGTRP